MNIEEKKNKKMPIYKVSFGAVIKVNDYYWIVVDKCMENEKTMIVNLDDGDWTTLRDDEEVEVVERAKLIIG